MDAVMLLLGNATGGSGSRKSAGQWPLVGQTHGMAIVCVHVWGAPELCRLDEAEEDESEEE